MRSRERARRRTRSAGSAQSPPRAEPAAPQLRGCVRGTSAASLPHPTPVRSNGTRTRRRHRNGPGMENATRRRRTTVGRARSTPDMPAPHDLADHLFHRDALTLAEQSAGIGVWSIDLTTGLVRGTAQFFRIMGLEPTGDEVPVEAVRAVRHADDRARVL